MSAAEESLWLQIVGQANVPRPAREYRFDPARGWRFDFAWPGVLPGEAGPIAVEMEGGVHRIKGRYDRDIEKYNRAELHGWTLLRVSLAMVNDWRAIALICEELWVEPRQRESVLAEELRQ